MSEKPFRMKPWMWILLAIATLLIVFNFDPIGDLVENIFGQGAKKMATNIILVIFIICVFFVGRKKQ